MLDTMYLRTISCLQNTLIYIIIVCKQTSVSSKIQSNFGPNVTSELLVRSGSESGRFLV
jgi:hypothetical protein